ncbi:MAG TPA: Hpt domain-containing protein [Beijerinckiaceae bacterium]|jgi:HPt (histidine-containing phosphotransfer) domain-containing protein
MSRSPTDSQEFDLVHLDRQTFGDAALQDELLRLFDEQCARLMPVIAGGTSRERADAAHTLKGAARAVGAWPVASRAEAFEEALARPASGHVAGHVDSLEAAVAAARAALARRRNR